MNFETSKAFQNVSDDIENQNLAILSKTNNPNNLFNSSEKIKFNKYFQKNKLKEVTENISKLQNQNEFSLTEINNIKNNYPLNLKVYNQSKIENINQGSKSTLNKKISLIKRPKINNLNIKPVTSTREELFKTEIKDKFLNQKSEIKKSGFSSTFTDFFNKQRNSLSLRNEMLKTENSKTKEENALLIPKEDMIFEEMKNYKCFKYFTKESLSRTSVPLIYINMNMNTTKNPPKKIKNKNPYQINFNNDVKKFIEYDDVFLSKQKPIFFDDEKKKQILKNVYRFPKDEDIYDKINLIKLKKDKKKLKNYQYHFLKIVQHNINDKYYEDLRNKFNEIRNLAEGKYKTNFKFIKEIEKNEEKLIKNINKTYENFMKYSTQRNIRKILNKPGRSKIDLPQIKFEKIINTDSISPIKKENHKNKKNNFISFSENKNMNRTSIKIKKKSIYNMNNITSFSYNKNMMKTSPKTFNKIKFFRDQI